MKKSSAQPKVYTVFLMPPSALKQAFNAAASDVPPDAKPNDVQNRHITLTYLKATRRHQIKGIVRKLEALEFPAFDIRLTGTDAFFRPPHEEESHVVWLRPDGFSGHKIQELRAEIYKALCPDGIDVGRTNIRPHMTLFRYPHSAEQGGLDDFLRKNADLHLPVWHCREFFLAESDKTERTGYNVVKSFTLKSPAL